MIFEYDEQLVFTQSIDVVDIGNMCLKCHRAGSSNAVFYYLRTKTVMGKTSFITYGPIVEGADGMINDFNVIYKRYDYKERQIVKDTNSFIHDPKKEIVLVEEVLEEAFWQNFPDIQDAFENYA